VTLTQLYAALCLPLLLTRVAFELLVACSDLPHPFIYAAALGVFLAFSLLGYEVEGYYFREVCEGKARLPRMLWFILGVPASYTVSLGLGVLGYALFPDLGFLVAVPVCVLSLSGSLWYLLTDQHHRGRRIYTARYMRGTGEAHLPPGDQGFPFGTVAVPSKMSPHRCYVGTTGSGKTTAIINDMAAFLPSIGQGPGPSLAIIYDPKTEFYEPVSRLAKCPIHTMHPFDIRGKAWALCKDLRTPKAALQFAVTLIPREEGPNSYFSNAARALVRSLIMSFILNSPDWAFRDLLLACESERSLRAVLSRNKITRRAIGKYLDIREKSSVLSTLDTFIDEYAPIAACWTKAEPISLREASEGNCVLILAQDEESPESLALINGLMIRFLTQMLLRQTTNEQLRREGKPERQVFLFLDEIRDIADRLPKPLTALLTRGRAYGISCVNGWQSDPGMKDALNPNRAAEIIAMHGLIGMLRVQDDETAKKFAAIIDEREVLRKSSSTSSSGTSHNWQITNERVVMPGAFSELATGEGYFLGPPPLALWNAKLPPPVAIPSGDAVVPNFIARPEFGKLMEPEKETDVLDPHQWLEPWNKTDLERLKLPLELLDDEPPQIQPKPQPSPPPPPGRDNRPGKGRLKVVDLRPDQAVNG
jgi:hypothetical protein